MRAHSTTKQGALTLIRSQEGTLSSHDGLSRPLAGLCAVDHVMIRAVQPAHTSRHEQRPLRTTLGDAMGSRYGIRYGIRCSMTSPLCRARDMWHGGGTLCATRHALGQSTRPSTTRILGTQLVDQAGELAPCLRGPKKEGRGVNLMTQNHRSGMSACSME